MARFDIFDTIEELREQGAPFCVATVIRTADATSAKAGAKAAVTAAGEIVGHLGGACLQRAVRDAAAKALDSGEPEVIRVKPSDKVVALRDPDGAAAYKSGCPSGGTVDLLIEPYDHPPRLVIFGATPIARALAAHAQLAGLRVSLLEDAAPLSLAPKDFVVVASQGVGDLAALRAAVESRARRVSLVASRRKASALTEKLIAAGVDQAEATRVKAPAGLDIKAVDPQEIAISVIAEIVLWRNADMRGSESRRQGEIRPA